MLCVSMHHFFSVAAPSFSFDDVPISFFLCLACFLASSGEVYELHADGDPDGEAPWWLQGTGPVLFPGRTQVLHPLEALAQE